MKMTLPHYTTQQKAIRIINRKAEELIERADKEFPWVKVIDPQKSWADNIMRFSFTVQKLFLTLDFEGTVIVTNQEVIGESNLPPIVTTFFSESKIKEVIKEKFNEIFNINPYS